MYGLASQTCHEMGSRLASLAQNQGIDHKAVFAPGLLVIHPLAQRNRFLLVLTHSTINGLFFSQRDIYIPIMIILDQLGHFASAVGAGNLSCHKYLVIAVFQLCGFFISECLKLPFAGPLR